MDEGFVTHKLVIIGDSDVGKTSLVRCFDEQTFDPANNPTVGASFLSKLVSVKGQQVVLNIWDTAGQERYRSLIPTYAHSAHAAILCYDVTTQRSFESLDSWLESLLRFASPDSLVYVVGNKIDLPEIVSQAESVQWARDHHAHCMFTSAKEGLGVTELFEAIAEAVIGFGASRDASAIEPRVKKGCC
jgi:small GTP-binding protein